MVNFIKQCIDFSYIIIWLRIRYKMEDKKNEQNMNVAKTRILRYR